MNFVDSNTISPFHPTNCQETRGDFWEIIYRMNLKISNLEKELKRVENENTSLTLRTSYLEEQIKKMVNENTDKSTETNEAETRLTNTEHLAKKIENDLSQMEYKIYTDFWSIQDRLEEIENRK